MRELEPPRGFLITPSDPEARMAQAAKAPASPARSAPLRTPVSTPTKLESASSTRAPPLSARSTRATGKADYFQPLDGAPEPKAGSTPRKASSKGRARRRSQALSDDDEDSEAELFAARPIAPKRTPVKARRTSSATKRAHTSRLPSPSSESDEHIPDADQNAQSEYGSEVQTSDDDAERPELVSPPSRKRAQCTTMLPLPPSPALSTPSKRRAASVTSAGARPLTPLGKRARRDAAVGDAEEGTNEQDVFGPVASTSTTPQKKAAAALVTPTATPSRSQSRIVTPSRSSSRLQRLPPSLAEIANAPANLRNRLVGFHMNDDGYGTGAQRSQGSGHQYGSDDELEDEDEEEEQSDEDAVKVDRRRAAKGKGKARMMEEDEQVEEDEDDTDEEQGNVSLLELLRPPVYEAEATQTTQSFSQTSSTSYRSSALHTHLASTLALLSGARLPRPFLAPDAQSTSPPRQLGLLSMPYLEGGYDEWERPLRSALDECVTKSMGNAVMLLGPRGVGKTMLVERTLALLSYVHGDEAFVTVRLSGLVHTTDRLALRSIAVQLQEQGFGTAGFLADEGDYSSNSSTMSTLLRLLEPSSASTASSSADGPALSSGSATTAKGHSKPLLLVVDEFDLFAAHPRQSFLYCLLDIVQGNRRSGGFAVVGISARVDCLSLLEKRVRSRCQSHVLQMIPQSSLTGLRQLAARLLKADERAWELVRGEEGKAWSAAWNSEVSRFLAEKKVIEYLTRLWSIHGNLPTELRSALSHLCYRLDAHARVNGIYGSNGVPRLSYDLLKPQPRGAEHVRDPLLKHLSVPQLTALIAAKHLSTSTLDRHAGFNFAMVYDAYRAHVQRVGGASGVGGVRALSKPALREAFDVLRAHELVLPRASNGGGGSVGGSGTGSAATAARTAGMGLPVSAPAATYRAPTQRDPWRTYRLTTWARDVDREVEARGAECPLHLRRWCKNWLD